MERRMVEISCGKEKRRIEGLVLGDLAVTQRQDSDGASSAWTITHLPTGGAFPAYYADEAAATRVMERLAKLRNSWDAPFEKLLEIRDQIIEALHSEPELDLGGPRFSPTAEDYVLNGYKGDPL